MNIVYVDELESTNVYAIEQLRLSDISEETCFCAKRQLRGKGQQGNFWESEDGKNLTFSVVLRPTFLPISQQYLMSKITCLALVDELKLHCQNVKVKWPNDIYVDDKKICGVLIENQLQGMSYGVAVIGVGLNVNQSTFVSDAPNPVSLLQITNKVFNLEQLLEQYLKRLSAYYQKLKDGEVEFINSSFHEHLYRLNQCHYFKDKEGSFRGVINGVNEIGQLIVYKEGIDEPFHYHFKEIAYCIS